MKKFLLLSLTFISLGLFADISPQEIAEIEQRVSSMGIKELRDRNVILSEELQNLSVLQENTQDPMVNKSTSKRIAAIRAELSAIQKALLAIVGAGAIASISDDGYDDNVPPVITIIGDNPATSELGEAYSDQGATAFDEFHGVTPVTSSGLLILTLLDLTSSLIQLQT